jgi:hypothetical protein
MKNMSTRVVYGYWDRLRGIRAAPERSEIEPAEIREALADAFVLEIEGGAPLFRLAGTRVSALFGRELKGVALPDLWSDAAGQEDVRRLVEAVTSETAGAVAGLVGETADGELLHLELLLLPLRHRGKTHARVMGALAPAASPAWLGLKPISRLRMISVRMIWPTGLLRNIANSVARQAGFVVLQGGKA